MLAVTKVLLGDPLQPSGDTAEADRSTAKTISDVRRMHALHWKCFRTDETLVACPSHRTYNTITTQKKRKRKDSDGEYTPYQYQRVDNNSSTSAARRTSKRLAVVAQPERPPSVDARPHRTIFTTKRSSSSTSALTSASSSSFDFLSTPKDPNVDLLASTSKPEESTSDISQYNWSDPDSSDPDSSDPNPPNYGTMTFPTVKVGLPSKEKKAVIDRDHSSAIKVGSPSPHT